MGFRMNGEKVKEEKIIDIINRYRDEYFEKYEKNWPNFGDDDCALVIRDGVSIVGLATVWAQRITIEAVREGYSYDNVLDAAKEFFSRHNTNWGVYTTQV